MSRPEEGKNDYWDSYDEEYVRPNKGERKGTARRSRRATKHQLKDYLYDSTDLCDDYQEEEYEDYGR